MTGGVGVMDMNGLSGSNPNFDAEDQRKQDDEVGFLIVEEVDR
jgi:hypothetical protein